jgi:hypothetical protein
MTASSTSAVVEADVEAAEGAVVLSSDKLLFSSAILPRKLTAQPPAFLKTIGKKK